MLLVALLIAACQLAAILTAGAVSAHTDLLTFFACLLARKLV
jgi:hypothetical protein